MQELKTEHDSVESILEFLDQHLSPKAKIQVTQLLAARKVYSEIGFNNKSAMSRKLQTKYKVGRSRASTILTKIVPD